MSVAELSGANIFDVGYEITQMLEADLKEVVEIEEVTGLSRWGYDAYKLELFSNPMSIMRVARGLTQIDGHYRVLGFVASRVTFDELHINNIATHPDFRRMRIGSELLKTVIRQSYGYGARRCLLEVRVTNEPAQRLYERLGFRVIGRRRDYYTQPTEDALVMQLIY